MWIRESALCPPPRRFAPDVGDAGLRAAIARSNDDPIPRAVTLAVLVPASPRTSRDADYARLHREISSLARGIDRDREIAELVVDASGVQWPLREFPWVELLAVIEHQFFVAAGTARTLLAGADSGPIGPEDVGVLKAAGFNRLAFAARRAEMPTVGLAHRCGIGSVSIRLDGSGEEPPLRSTVDAVLEARPERLEIHAAAPAAGPDGTRLRAALEDAGYEFIGPDQYALHDDELARASRAGDLRFGVFGYTAASDCDVLGAGPQAISQVGDCVARNASSLAVWRDAVDRGRLPAVHGAVLTTEDRLRSAVVQALLCRREIPVRELEAAFDLDFRRHFAAELQCIGRTAAGPHVCDSGDRIEVDSQGWLWLRTMARCFAQYESRPPH